MNLGVCTGPCGVWKEPQRADVRGHCAVIWKPNKANAALCRTYVEPHPVTTPIARRAPPWLGDLAGAWIFYSILPAWPWPSPRFERIARFAPWIGCLLGSLQAGLWMLLVQLGWLSVAVAPLVLAVGIWLSGGLHHDGVMDTADGLAAGRERRLVAMDDSRVGASGVLALAMVLLVEASALIQLDAQAPLALVFAAVIGRGAPLWAMARFGYLRSQDTGTAAFHRLHGRPLWDALPLLLVLVLFVVFAGLKLVSLLIGCAVAVLVPELLGRRLGGHTGDSYGASLVLAEAFTLLSLALVETVAMVETAS